MTNKSRCVNYNYESIAACIKSTSFHTYYVFSVYKIHVMLPIRPLQMNVKYE